MLQSFLRQTESPVEFTVKGTDITSDVDW